MCIKKKISVITFPGSNCDRDLIVAIRKILNIEPEIIWHKESKINKTNMILIPGGFSYGDYLRAGVLATKSPAIQEVIRYSKKGIPIVGICNGFQILTECKLLPGILMKNTNPKFLCKDVYLKLNKNNKFSTLHEKPIIKLPIAHSQGNFFLNKSRIKPLIDNQQIVYQYCNEIGLIEEKSNPNGSIFNIAGITNSRGNVLGMMPHPERAIKNSLIDGEIFFKKLENLL